MLRCMQLCQACGHCVRHGRFEKHAGMDSMQGVQPRKTATIDVHSREN